ncbi:MAG: DeoR/GlpR family DNA-binding transcription regulator [Bilifractor sp.]|jgi:DeoR/GlpR family transcriptional regulator of sugar metabolism
MKTKERLDYIRDRIEKEGSVRVQELREECQVTEETVRRDLDRLEAEGYITRTHGGAVWRTESSVEGIYFYKRRVKNLREKKKIAQKLRSFISGRRTLVADSSTTVEEGLAELKDKADLTIVTNSAEIFHMIPEASFSIISTGGIFNRQSLSFQGEITRQTMKWFNVDLAVISCKGICMDMGVMDSYESEADVKRSMLAQAGEVVLLVDHTKFDHVAFLKLMDFEKVDFIITDRKPSDEWVQFCKEKGIHMMY